jgi:hypothetical protein
LPSFGLFSQGPQTVLEFVHETEAAVAALELY